MTVDGVINNKHKLIFLPSQKCASTSTYLMLKASGGVQENDNMGSTSLDGYRNNGYSIFTIARTPMSRAISAWKWFTSTDFINDVDLCIDDTNGGVDFEKQDIAKLGIYTGMPFDDFINVHKPWATGPGTFARPAGYYEYGDWLESQYSTIVHCDYILRISHLSSDLKSMLSDKKMKQKVYDKLLGNLPHKNKTQGKYTDPLISEDSEQWINEHFIVDINNLPTVYTYSK